MICLIAAINSSLRDCFKRKPEAPALIARAANVALACIVSTRILAVTPSLRIPVKPNGIPEEAEQHSGLKANTIEV
jgi:hypothetical protein